MATFARVVLVCILVSTGLLKHTLSRPSVPEEDEEYNEIDFEDRIPIGKDAMDPPYGIDDHKIDDEDEYNVEPKLKETFASGDGGFQEDDEDDEPILKDEDEKDLK